jgi:hypothetical protein
MIRLKTIELIITIEYRALQAMIAAYCGERYNCYTALESHPRHYRAMKYISKAIAAKITELGNIRNLHLIPELSTDEALEIIKYS